MAAMPPEAELASATARPPAKSAAGEAGISRPDGAVPVERLRYEIDGIVSKLDEMEQKVDEVDQFYANRKPSKVGKDGKERKMWLNGFGNQGTGENGLSGRDGAGCTKRMQELMRQFGTILRQISQHKWAWPFLEPVDVEGLGLHDYYDIIKKPMDFGTIKNQMEAKDGTGYRNVREIYADVRLVFTNAMTYNDEKHDIHVMAKTLLDKFEEKWLQLLPKVIEEERRQKEEEDQALENMKIAQEAAMVRMAQDMNNELTELNLHLEELRKMVVQKCRKMSAEEKRRLGAGLSSLSAEDLRRVLEIIAENNPNFQATTEEVDIDLDEQSETTLWKLKFFMKEIMERQNKSSPCKPDENLKRRKEICDAIALAKTSKKRNKLLSLVKVPEIIAIAARVAACRRQRWRLAAGAEAKVGASAREHGWPLPVCARVLGTEAKAGTWAWTASASALAVRTRVSKRRFADLSLRSRRRPLVSPLTRRHPRHRRNNFGDFSVNRNNFGVLFVKIQISMC